MDLAQLNDFTTFFSLISHSDRRIQTAALTTLKKKKTFKLKSSRITGKGEHDFYDLDLG